MQVRRSSCKLIERIKRTSEVESFRFSVPEPINFMPGQFAKVIFEPGQADNRESNKYISFSSSPLKSYIEITKKISDSKFSKGLTNLKINDEVIIEAPFGRCVFKDEYKEIAFLIGGIGITPVISIIEYIVEKKLDTNIVLFYSNRLENFAFKKELDAWHSRFDNLKVIYTVTDCQPRDFKCISGRMTKELLAASIDSWQERMFFIFGPPNMVKAMDNLCKEARCNEDMVKMESFIGY